MRSFQYIFFFQKKKLIHSTSLFYNFNIKIISGVEKRKNLFLYDKLFNHKKKLTDLANRRSAIVTLTEQKILFELHSGHFFFLTVTQQKRPAASRTSTFVFRIACMHACVHA